MNRQFAELYDRHAVAAFDKQLHLTEVVAGRDWSIDLASGLLSFGDGCRWQVQLLGTESEANSTWLWSWANKDSNIPADLLRSAMFLRGMGDLLRLPELTEAQLPLDELDGHFLGILASGVCQAAGYFR